MHAKKLSVLLLCAALAACAHNPGGSGAHYVPVVDLRPGQSPEQANADLATCQQYATQRMDALQGAAQAAVAGAIFGAILGAAAGGNGRFNSRMAGVGAVSAGASGAGSAETTQRGIIIRCMAGRGYNVLD